MKKSVVTREGLVQLWNSITTLFVRKETGKGLSSNDFTNSYKNKIDESYPKIQQVEYDLNRLKNRFDETVGTTALTPEYMVPLLEENELISVMVDTIFDAIVGSSEELSTIILDLHSRIKALEDKS